MTRNESKKERATGDRMLGETYTVLRQVKLAKHSHKHDELYICIGGSAVDTVNGITATISPGDIYVAPFDSTHEQTDVVNFRCCIFKFDRARLLERAAGMRLVEKPVFRELFANEKGAEDKSHPASQFFVDATVMRYAEELVDIMKRENDSDILDTLFLSLVALLISRCNRKLNTDGHSLPEGITEAVYYMEQNFDKPLSLDSLALRAHYSPRHFTRLMQKHYGVSPMEHLDAIRMRHACDLLLYTSCSVTQISRLCGFEDNNLFSRHFRIALGISPTEYRQKNRHAQRAAFSDVNIIN